MEVQKVSRESIPAVKLIGKRYGDKDRDDNGTFASRWQQAFREGWFDVLGKCLRADGVSGDYLAAMRVQGEAAKSFEYWIGMFCAPESEVPEGFLAADIPAGELGVCWLYGNEQNGELFGREATEMCATALKTAGMDFSMEGWFFERYNCPRYTTPDERGNVILDIIAYLR